ncbi:MAG: THxN family PEP-CTERM protein [Limnothrix sp.]|nr:THxN family PEP-CTERM protein [Limnothrix sp.]
MRLTISAAIISIATAIASANPAAALTLLNSSGSWGTPSGTPFYSFQTVGAENQVRWGIPASEAGPSGLGFTGVGATPITLGSIFQLGTLRHFNNPIYDAANSVGLSVTLDFAEIADEIFNFTMNIDETTNSGTCSYFSVTPCADKISWNNALGDRSFSYDGKEYTLELSGFKLSPDGELVSDFISQEGGTSEAYLYGRIREVPEERSTPEPSLMFGLAGFAALGLRRRWVNS